MTTTDPTAPRRPGGVAPTLLRVLLVLAAAATTASGDVTFDCPDGVTCTSWSDGCNTCGLDPKSGEKTCTKRHCPCLDDDSCVPECLDNKECRLAGIGGDLGGDKDGDPIMCMAEWKPVCGANLKAYSNACKAEAAGQEVMYEIEKPGNVTDGKTLCPALATPADADVQHKYLCRKKSWRKKNKEKAICRRGKDLGTRKKCGNVNMQDQSCGRNNDRVCSIATCNGNKIFI